MMRLSKYLSLAAFCLCAASPLYCSAFDRLNLSLVYDGQTHAYTAEEILISINGKQITGLPMPPISIDNRTLVPAREVFEALGCTVEWDNSAKKTIVTREDDRVELTIDSAQAVRNQEPFVIEVPPKVIYIEGEKNGKTMIPLRAAAEALNCKVDWHADTRTVTIDDGASLNPAPPDNSAASGEKNTIFSAEVHAENRFVIKTASPMLEYRQIPVDDARLVLDFPNTTFQVSPRYDFSDNPYITSMRFGQFDEETARAVFDLTGEKEYSVALSEDKCSLIVTFGSVQAVTPPVSPTEPPEVPDTPAISPAPSQPDDPESPNYDPETPSVNPNPITPPTEEPEEPQPQPDLSAFQNLSYDPGNAVLQLSQIQPINIQDVVHHDDYRNNSYQIVLPGDFTATYGAGTGTVGDSWLASLSIESTTDGNTALTLHTNRILGVTVSQAEDTLTVKLRDPRELYDKVVMLDAGHGGSDPGAIPNGLIEKDLNLDIIKRVYNRLEQDGIVKAYAVRLDDTRVDNAQRAYMANQAADLFVSVHQNSNDSAKPNGTEVLYNPHASESEGRLTSIAAAQLLQKKLIVAMGTNDRGIKERPGLIVLNRTTVPAVLIETCFISNQQDGNKIKSEAFRQTVADAICEGIYELFETYPYR